MDQAKTNLPKIRIEHKAKSVDDEADNLRTRIIGVFFIGFGGPPRLYLYVVYGDEVHGNGNLTAHILYDVLHKTKCGIPWADMYDDDQLRSRGLLPRHEYKSERPLPGRLVLQLDNTCKENKNCTVISACAFLVNMGFVSQVDINFLIVGHAHNEIDQMFGVISRRIKRRDVFTVDQLLELLRESMLLDRVNDRELESKFGESTINGINRYLDFFSNGLRPCVQLLRRVTDFTRFFQCIPKLKNITRCQQFTVALGRDDPLTVYAIGRRCSGSNRKTGVVGRTTYPSQIQQDGGCIFQTQKTSAKIQTIEKTH
jgi:hypothetical protein